MWRVSQSAYEWLKRRQHRGVLLPFGAVVMFIHTEEHFVPRMGDGFEIRSRAVKEMLEKTTLEDLDTIKGSPWTHSGDLREVLPEVPRPIQCR